MRGCALILWAHQGWKQKSLLPIRKDLITVFAASHLSLYLPSFSSRRSNTVSQQVFFHRFLDSQSGLRVAARVSLTQCESAFVYCLFTFSSWHPVGLKVTPHTLTVGCSVRLHLMPARLSALVFYRSFARSMPARPHSSCRFLHTLARYTPLRCSPRPRCSPRTCVLGWFPQLMQVSVQSTSYYFWEPL